MRSRCHRLWQSHWSWCCGHRVGRVCGPLHHRPSKTGLACRVYLYNTYFIANVKRKIDKLNQQRNDWIEKIDEWLVGDLAERRISPASGAPKNTETPGSAIDRLSIMSLRLFHLDEQTGRSDATPSLLASVDRKIAVGVAQQRDLAQSLRELLEDIYAGRRSHGTYRQMKMYNDPQLNPYLYNAKLRKVG